MIQMTSDEERAWAVIESGRVRYAAASHRGSDSPISRETNGRRQSRPVASGGAASGAPFSSRRVRILTGDQVDVSTPAMRAAEGARRDLAPGDPAVLLALPEQEHELLPDEPGNQAGVSLGGDLAEKLRGEDELGRLLLCRSASRIFCHCPQRGRLQRLSRPWLQRVPAGDRLLLRPPRHGGPSPAIGSTTLAFSWSPFSRASSYTRLWMSGALRKRVDRHLTG